MRIQFFSITLLVLIFDIEITLLIPIIYYLKYLNFHYIINTTLLFSFSISGKCNNPNMYSLVSWIWRYLKSRPFHARITNDETMRFIHRWKSSAKNKVKSFALRHRTQTFINSFSEKLFKPIKIYFSDSTKFLWRITNWSFWPCW